MKNIVDTKCGGDVQGKFMLCRHCWDNQCGLTRQCEPDTANDELGTLYQEPPDYDAAVCWNAEINWPE